MSTLVMVMAAGMMPGDGPEKVSGEIVQGLDMRRLWEGLWIDSDGIWRKAELNLRECELIGERLPGQIPGDISQTLGFLSIKDDGAGHIRLGDDLGIYNQDNTCLIICFRDHRKGYPTSFRGGNGQNLLILRRVRTRK